MTDTERRRRPQNLKPCHEVRVGVLGAWCRVLDVKPHPHLRDQLNVWVDWNGDRHHMLLTKDRPVWSRLAEHDTEAKETT